MIYTEEVSVQEISLHNVGNKLQDEGLLLSKSPLEVDDNTTRILTSYFLTPFKSEEYYHLYHDTDITLNEVCAYVSKIFDDPKTLHEQSVNLAKHLYQQSNHAKIKSGEFYAVYFTDCIINNETVDAVGLFKSENKDTFLKVYPSGDSFEVESEQGVNINKLDKG